MIINGYKPLDDWKILVAICFIMLFIGFMASQIMNPVPRQIQEVHRELVKCHLDTNEVCSIMVMPDIAHDEIYLLYSKYVK